MFIHNPDIVATDTTVYMTMQIFAPMLNFIFDALLGYVSKITKAHFHRLNLHIFVKKPRSSTNASAFFASICKLIWQNCIFQTLETHPNRIVVLRIIRKK